ncbi:metallophosphoesterase [Salipaludibacillus sp. CUR1]|uniref:metallophosphoesterase n=1 Tax=Salipaludibacillus sp. CUR1 TaxID=2820003 RepID=UPI001E2F04EB|nr:metallophosphoesterase [Salipaludibacillus sp. CUR1]MCE7791039.1 metallophosphoesterase [Salipaludibacillus sp. CUR1]
MFIVVFLVTVLILIFIYSYYQAKGLVITEEEIMLPGIEHTQKLLFITDLHKRLIKEDMFSKLPPVDFVIIGGDAVEKGVPEEIISQNLSFLSSLGTAFFVWGNNDYEFGEKKLKQLLDKYNIHQLNNSSYYIDHPGAKWTLAGVEDLGTLHADINQALQDANEPVILVSHNPETANLLFNSNRKVEAVLSGHTHGGQIRLGPLAAGEKGGWKVKNNIPVFISNGFGTTGIPFRLGAKPQIHLFTLKKRPPHNINSEESGF